MLISNGCIDSSLHWFNEPAYQVHDNQIILKTKPGTDFWQRTHYGFRRDDGHCLFSTISTDFLLTVHTIFEPSTQYDQCGLMVRLDAENWIKASIEYENSRHSRLGSVVTNLGYSDWATQDIDGAIHSMHYRIQSRGRDFLLEYSHDGQVWQQMRVAHLHTPFNSLQVGLYACSPMSGSFTASFDGLLLSESIWDKEQ